MLRQVGHEAVGVTLSEVEARVCREQGFTCHVADLTRTIPFEPGSFDGLLLSHVLEHFPFPDEVLKQLLLLLRPEGGAYVALSNVLYLRQELEFLWGGFVTPKPASWTGRMSAFLTLLRPDCFWKPAE